MAKRTTRKSQHRRFWANKLRTLVQIHGPTRWKQFGGGVSNTESNVSSENSYSNSSNILSPQSFEKVIEYNGKQYKYRETEDMNHIYLYRESGRPCFEVDINIEDGVKHAHLNTLYNFPNCSVGVDSTGRDMLLAIVEILKPRTDIVYMGFSDHSGKEIAPNIFIRLSDVYFVATGKTWYGSILPLEPDDKQFFQENYEAITSASWKDVIARLESYYKGPITIPVNMDNINPAMPGSAMQMFRRIKDAKTDFFAKYRTRFMRAANCNSFFASTWRYYFNRTTPEIAV